MSRIISNSLLNQDSLFQLGLNFDLQFPEDLFSQRMGGNFMVFFINEQKEIVGSNKDAIKVRRKVYDVNGNRKEEIFNRRATAASSELGNRRVNTSTLTTGAVALYIPGKLDVNYSTKYDEVDLDFIMGNVAKGEIGNLVQGGLATLTTKEGKILAASELGKALASGTFEQLIDKGKTGILGALGIALNPFKQIFFSGLGFRKFSFDFTMMPRNSKEAQMINDIVNVFRYHMHPEEKSGMGGRFFIAPSDFDIEFYRIYENSDDTGKSSGQAKVFENEFLFSISTCVLTDMSVNYTPASEGFITHHDGTPLGVNMKLSFTETEILTKKRIAEMDKNKYLKKEIVSPTVREVR